MDENFDYLFIDYIPFLGFSNSIGCLHVWNDLINKSKWGLSF